MAIVWGVPNFRIFTVALYCENASTDKIPPSVEFLFL